MTRRQQIIGGCLFLGLVAVAGMGAARLAEDEVVTRRRAMRQAINTLAAPLLERLDRLEKFRETEIDHKLAITRAEVDAEQAAKTVEVMEISLKEYKEGTFPTEVQVLQGEIKLAESELEKAADKQEWSDRMLKEGKVTELENQADHLAVDKANYNIEKAKRSLVVLQNFTKMKRITEIQSEIEKARSHYLALKNRVETVKENHAAARRKVTAEATLSRDEFRVLVLLRDAIALQADKKLDEAQEKIDEAARVAQIEEDRREQERLLDTEARLSIAIRALGKSVPKGE